MPTGTFAEAFDINDVGVIVGSSSIGEIRAVKWQSQAVADLGVPGGYLVFPGELSPSQVHSSARGIGATGIIVGTRWKEEDGTTVLERWGAFRWTAAAGVDSLPGLAAAPGLSTRRTGALAVNGQGTAVGYSETATGRVHAVRWTAAGAIVDIHPAWAASSSASDINEEGWISGHASGRGGTEAVVWTPGGVPIPLGLVAHRSDALGINDSVQTVGLAVTQSGTGNVYLAVLWPTPAPAAGTVIFPCLQSSGFTVAKEISNLGRIVGGCRIGSDYRRAWTRHKGSSELLPIFPVAGPTFAQANAVNTCGVAVGRVDAEAVVWTRINTSGPSGAPVCDK